MDDSGGAVTPAQQVLVPSLFDGSLHPGPAGGKGEPANMALHWPPARCSGNDGLLWGDLKRASQVPQGEAHWSPVAACDTQGPSWPHPRDALRHPAPRAQAGKQHGPPPVGRHLATSGKLSLRLKRIVPKLRLPLSQLPAVWSGSLAPGTHLLPQHRECRSPLASGWFCSPATPAVPRCPRLSSSPCARGLPGRLLLPSTRKGLVHPSALFRTCWRLP